MSKSDYPALRMRVERGRLAPASQFDQERLDSYRNGAIVMCRLTEERDRVLVKKWFAIIGLVLKTCETPWKNKDEAHEAIKLALGIVNLSKTVSGQFMQYPKSLTELDDPEMTEALEQMTELLSRMTGVDVETLKRETAHIGADEANTPSDEADSPPGSADAGVGSPADALASEEADNPPPSASSTIPEAELLKLRAYAKDVLHRAAEGTMTSAIEKRWGSEIAEMSDAAKEIARSVSMSVRAIIKDDVSVNKAIEFHSEMLGVDPEDLGGRADG